MSAVILAAGFLAPAGEACSRFGFVQREWHAVTTLSGSNRQPGLFMKDAGPIIVRTRE